MSRWYVDDKVTILLLTCLASSQSADLRGSGQCRLPSPGGQWLEEAAPLMWYTSLLSSNNVHVYLVSNIVIFDWICQLISTIPSVEEPSGSACPVTRILKQGNVDLFFIVWILFFTFLGLYPSIVVCLKGFVNGSSISSIWWVYRSRASLILVSRASVLGYCDYQIICLWRL